MMNTVADQVLKQFADNFAARVGAIQPAARPLRPARPARRRGAPPPRPRRPGPRRRRPRELNGLALSWAVFANWLRGLFGKKAS